MPDMERSSRLGLPYLMPSQAQKHVTHNDALQLLDAVVQLSVVQFGGLVPPVSPAVGDTHAPGPLATGDWAGQAGRLAVWAGNAWIFVTPTEGWRAHDQTGGGLRILRAGVWQPLLQDLDGLGIGTVSDATNRLAVAAPGVRFSHPAAGDGSHRMSVNMAQPTDTASLLFQSGWSGRAEMGLAGSEDFALRVSPDGTGFTTALTASRTTGKVSLPAGADISGLLTGTAVQSGAGDSTAGRLLTVGAFGTGTTGSGLTLADLNAVGTPAGSYRFVFGTSTGTPPVAVNGYVEVRRYAADFLRQTFAREEGANRGQWTREYRTSAWTAWERVLRNHNLLGSASQSAGVPTGAVLERGSNANGEYTRFACGTQICWVSASVTPVANTVTTLGFTWPAAFVAAPAAVANPVSAVFGPTDTLRVWHVSDRTTTGFTARVLRTNTTVSLADVVATGRWF